MSRRVLFERHLLSLLCLTLTLPALAGMPEKDTVPEGKDHPLLTRFAGSKLVGYDVKAFDEISLPASKQITDSKSKEVFEKIETIEGEITRIGYNFPKDRSALEVMRSYQTALQTAGMKTIFSCNQEECGKYFGGLMLKHFESNFFKGSSDYWAPFNNGREKERYPLSKGTQSNGIVTYALIYVVGSANDRNGGVFQEIVELKAMETGKVTASLSADDMGKSLSAQGKVAVYGILFDTDKATLKAESKPVLAEMAKLLQKEATLKVYLVNHTDNQGALARNVELSQQRADAVMKALVTEYRVDAKRMGAKSVGPYAPAASNDTDAGKEKNRRVELVKQ